MFDRKLKVGDIEVTLLWFDSMGAKCSSIFVQTPDIKLLVDPGAAGMQPSYPLPDDVKDKLRAIALERISSYAQQADVIFISHYHYDHHTLPEKVPHLYDNKILYIKDPNRWINYSQWERARLFLGQLLGDLEYIEPQQREFSFPMPIRVQRPDAEPRIRKRFLENVATWQTNAWVKEPTHKGIYFADGMTVKFGDTVLRFTEPLFHGEEYTKTGWLIALVVEHRGTKLLYTSDLQGPVVEQYADWIIDEQPDILIIDGPPTYLLGYVFAFRNMDRVINNMERILEETTPEIIIYDHHPLREPKYTERLAPVYEKAQRLSIPLLTAMEFFGMTPLIHELEQADLLLQYAGEISHLG